MDDEAGRGDAEWLDVGPGGRRGSSRRRRSLLIAAVGLVIVVLVAGLVAVARPGWQARNQRLSEDQVRAALAGLDLADLRLRSIAVDLEEATPVNPCAPLTEPRSHHGPGGVRAVAGQGTVPADRSDVGVLVMLSDDPVETDERFAAIERALTDETCLEAWEVGRISVDPPPRVDRQLAWGVEITAGSFNGERWWFRARVLRYGTTITVLSSFGPIGSADVTAPLVEALDRGYAGL